MKSDVTQPYWDIKRGKGAHEPFGDYILAINPLLLLLTFSLKVNMGAARIQSLMILYIRSDIMSLAEPNTKAFLLVILGNCTTH